MSIFQSFLESHLAKHAHRGVQSLLESQLGSALPEFRALDVVDRYSRLCFRQWTSHSDASHANTDIGSISIKGTNLCTPTVATVLSAVSNEVGLIIVTQSEGLLKLPLTPRKYLPPTIGAGA